MEKRNLERRKFKNRDLDSVSNGEQNVSSYEGKKFSWEEIEFLKFYCM